MNFLHYTIIPQNDFLFSIALKTLSTTKIEVLLAYKNRIDFGLIFTTKDRISLDIHDSFYLESPILWATVYEDHMFSFTESNHFKITTMYPSFNLIFDEHLEKHNFKYFSVSWNHRFICAAFDQSDFLLIDIHNAETPNFYLHSLENKIILDISADKSDNFFAFLVEEGNRKYTIIYDAQQNKVSKTIDEENDSISYIHSLDPRSRDLYILHPNYITLKAKTILTTETEIQKASCKLNDIAHFSLSDGTLLSYSFKNDSISLLTNSPEIYNFFPLPNFTLLCHSTENQVFLIKVTENKKSSIMNFNEIDKYNVNDITQINQLFSLTNQLYFSDKHGNFNQICNRFSKNKAEFIKQFDFEGNLLSLKDEPLLYSNQNTTRIVIDSKTTASYPNLATDKKTISFLQFRKKSIQVTQDGLYCEGNREVTFDSKCILASSKGDQLVCVLETNEIILYSKTFKNMSSFEIDLDGALITSVDVSASFIAVASFHDDAKIGQIFLLDFDFNGYGEEFSFPSKMTKIFFRKNDSEIYIISENGSIAKCLVNEGGLTSDISYIYFGDMPHSITFIDDDSFTFISNSKLFKYSNNRIFPTGIKSVKTTAYNGTNFFIIDKKLRLYAISSGELTEKYTIQNLPNFQNIIQIKFFLDFLFVLDHQGLHVKNPLNTLNKIFDVDSFKIENSQSFVIFQKSKRNAHSMRIVVLTKNNEILYFKFCSNKLVLLSQDKIRAQIKIIKNWFDFLFLVFNNGSLTVCRYIKKELFFMRTMLNRNIPISNIEIYKNYVWIVFGCKIISVYQPNFDYEQLELVAEDCDYYSYDISYIKPIDELTVIISYTDGLFCIKEIENNVAHGFLFHNEHNFGPPKLHELNRVQLGSTITSIINNNSFLIYSTVNGSIGYLISVKSQSVFQNLSIMQNRMRNEYIRHIGICSGKYNSLCSTIGIVDYNFIQSYLNIEKNTDLIQFYDVTSLTCLLQYINL